MVDTIKYISIFFVTIPLILSTITFRSFRLSPPFFWLLLIGFIADLFNLLYETESAQKQIIWDLYSVFECTMLIWIVQYKKNALAWSAWIRILLLISIPLWIGCTYLYGNLLAAYFTIAPLSLFIILYEVYVIFYSTKEILWISERGEKMTLLPEFWIFFGVFFYSIGTFFIMGFLSAPSILAPIFYINNIVNITTHLLFSIGLCIFSCTSFKTIR